jgi:hypothetical protein
MTEHGRHEQDQKDKRDNIGQGPLPWDEKTELEIGICVNNPIEAQECE